MLREIHIKNIAVIEEVTVELDNGFQTLTGETGAGKSILIDSINMALGARSSRDLIRTGAEEASVDLAFEIEEIDTLSRLAELGVECEDSTVLVSRRIYADGKSRCQINGRLTPLNIVKEAGELLLTIHGQNDNQSILSPKCHIQFVDDYGKNDALLCEYREQYLLLKETESKLKELECDESEKERLVELLKFQLDEIDAAKLKSGEDEELSKRRSFLQNTEHIAESAGGAYYLLYGSDESDDGVCDKAGRALRKLESASGYDGRLSGLYERLSSAMAEIDDVTQELRSYVDGLDYSQADLDSIETRLALINNLSRKYGGSIDEVLAYAEQTRSRLSAVERSDERREELAREVKEAGEKLSEIGERLTRARVDAALKLQESIMHELADLDMQKMRFSVSIEPAVSADGEMQFLPDGCDRVEFMISANPGEALKPLSKIASGGEMSRIMLAIKSVLSDTDRVETLIFDEIDTGVSGRAAQKIAEKMGMLSAKRQLICITHLAQIAAMADRHYLIEKNSDDNTTKTTVSLISGEERQCELARIIGGVRVTDLTLGAAKEMLDMAESYKRSVKFEG